MQTFTFIVTRLFDVLVAPFGSHRTAGLIALSLLAGAALTLLYRATSDARRIRRTREVFKARVLEMRLYPDDVVLILRALAGAIASQGQYLRAAAKPILIVALVAIPVFLQIEARYAHAPLAPGSHTVVTTRLKKGLDVLSVPTSLRSDGAGDGLGVDVRSVRAPASREVAWRVGVNTPGRHAVELQVYNQSYRFNVSATHDGRALGAERRARSLAGALADIGLPRIESNSPIDAVTVAYPPAHYRIFGMQWSWLAVFAAASVLGASIPAFLLRVAL